MAIADLVGLVLPPPNPNQLGSPSEWEAVEQTLGLRLPSDFHQYIHTYGTGTFARFYWIWNPYWGQKFLDEVTQTCGFERQAQEKFPEFYPYAIYPLTPGFLPWGSDENGNIYGWYTDGKPDDWPVLSNNLRGHGYRIHRCSMTSYLALVLRGEIRSLAGDYFTAEDMEFCG